MEHAIAPIRRFTALYDGKVLLFKQLPAARALVKHVQDLLEGEFVDPPTAHKRDHDFVIRTESICQRFSSDATATQLWEDVILQASGVEKHDLGIQLRGTDQLVDANIPDM
eukprot:m.484151 g.484151  ORF g.484151 m.484151 type:complete len:111 (-) comp21730_c2_seq22:1526-1858(-)